jgi:hypothetical protein
VRSFPPRTIACVCIQSLPVLYLTTCTSKTARRVCGSSNLIFSFWTLLTISYISKCCT